MDRVIAEIKLKGLVKFGQYYNKEDLYLQLRTDVQWSCILEKGEQFMGFTSFERWVRKMDWIELKPNFSVGENQYYRTDEPECKMSNLYIGAMKLLNKAKEPKSWFR